VSAATRHLLDVTDFAAHEVREILALAEQPIVTLDRPLAGAGVALIFEKPSNRTRHSMEMAVFQLGGHPVYTRGEEVGFDTREPVEDIARILEGYHAIIAARVFDHLTVTRMAAVVDIPVINMLSDHSHPLQAFADALTMQQSLGQLAGKTVAYVGDFNNVARSLAEISSMLGMHIRFACPHGFDAPLAELERFSLLGAASVEQSTRPAEAVAGAHAVHTDTWVSMGQEDDKQQRIQQFEGYTVDADTMALADPSAVFMHCLPAYRGLEVAADVIDGPQSVVFRQGHNRLHAARGAMAFLLGERPHPTPPDTTSPDTTSPDTTSPDTTSPDTTSREDS
jgi:ornithine carbamoyltransferase